MNPPDTLNETAAETIRRNLPHSLGRELYLAILEVLSQHDQMMEAIAELNARIKALKKNRY